MIEQTQDRFMRVREVMEMCALSRPGVYVAMETKGFPRPVKIGNKAVRWRLSHVLDWMDSREVSTGDLGRGQDKRVSADVGQGL